MDSPACSSASAAFGDQAAGGGHCVAARAKHVVNRTRDMFDRPAASCTTPSTTPTTTPSTAVTTASAAPVTLSAPVAAATTALTIPSTPWTALHDTCGGGAGALNDADGILRRGGHVGDRRDQIADILSSLTADRFGSGMRGRLGERLNRVKPGLCGVSGSGRTAEHQVNPGAHQIANHGLDRAGGITDHVADIATDHVTDLVDRGTCRAPCGAAGRRGTVLDEIADLIENCTGIAANGVTDGVEGVARGAKRAVSILGDALGWE